MSNWKNYTMSNYHRVQIWMRKLSPPTISVLWENFMKVCSLRRLKHSVHHLCILVTVARAMNAKQDNTLISSISNQISQYFEMGGKALLNNSAVFKNWSVKLVFIIPIGQQLASLDDRVVGQWRMYFGLKAKFYLAEVCDRIAMMRLCRKSNALLV